MRALGRWVRQAFDYYYYFQYFFLNSFYYSWMTKC